MPTLEPDRTFAVAEQLHSAAIHLLRRLRVQDAASGIGPARLSALSVLVFGGPRSLKELAGIEQVRPPTMSRVVAALEVEGLVRRDIAPDDARRIILRATFQGRRVLLAARKRRLHDLAERLARLSERDVGNLERCATVLRGMLRDR